MQQLMDSLTTIADKPPRREGSRTPRRGKAKYDVVVHSSPSPELMPADLKQPPGDACARDFWDRSGYFPLPWQRKPLDSQTGRLRSP